MNLLVLKGHLIRPETYEAWNGWGAPTCLCFCGYDYAEDWNRQAIRDGDLQSYNPLDPTRALCGRCVEHPDYALFLLGDLP